MKKTGLAALMMGITVLVGAATSVSADDNKDSKTTDVTSKVTRGTISLTVPGKLEYPDKPLDSVVDFGELDATYSVTDYTADVNTAGKPSGYTITAKADKADTNREFKIGSVAITDADNTVITSDGSANDEIGKNDIPAKATLKYSNLKVLGDQKVTITWTLTKATSLQIGE